jgi:hypothetical protein
MRSRNAAWSRLAVGAVQRRSRLQRRVSHEGIAASAAISTACRTLPTNALSRSALADEIRIVEADRLIAVPRRSKAAPSGTWLLDIARYRPSARQQRPRRCRTGSPRPSSTNRRRRETQHVTPRPVTRFSTTDKIPYLVTTGKRSIFLPKQTRISHPRLPTHRASIVMALRNVPTRRATMDETAVSGRRCAHSPVRAHELYRPEAIPSALLPEE